MTFFDPLAFTSTGEIDRINTAPSALRTAIVAKRRKLMQSLKSLWYRRVGGKARLMKFPARRSSLVNSSSLVNRFIRSLLSSVIRPIPLNKSPQPGFNRRDRFEIDVACKVVHIRICSEHVSWLKRQQVFFCLSTQRILQDFDQTKQLNWFVIADVVDSKWCVAGTRIWLIARPTRIQNRCFLHYSNYAFDYVVDVSEITLHLPIVVDIYWLAFKDRLSE